MNALTAASSYAPRMDLNTWSAAHADAVGVAPGTYMNINAGFFSASMEHHRALLEEWRNLMTRRKPFDLWHGDQGALNAILDKYSVPKVLVGEKADWNQTWLNESLSREGDGIAAFLGDEAVGWGAYARCLQPRSDAAEFEFIGFEAPNYRNLQATRDRFANVKLLLVEKLVWIYDGTVPFDSDGASQSTAACWKCRGSRREFPGGIRIPQP